MPPRADNQAENLRTRPAISDEYKKAIDAVAKKVTPDAVTGKIEFNDIVQYISTHTDDPDVVKFLSQTNDQSKESKEEREQALATFDINKLWVQPGSIWLVALEYAGLSNEERLDDNWPGRETENLRTSLPKDGEPVQTFQLFCYIKDGDDCGDSRHVEDFVGLPTTQQIIDFLKISMAKPIPCYEPCIPATLGFSYNLNVHKQALQAFLRTLPWSCNVMFETAQIRDKMADKDYAFVAAKYREYIDTATKVKEAGNKAYAERNRSKALAKYDDAIGQLDKLLMKKISEEEERDKETRALLAVCWANCSAARMLDVAGGGPDAKGAKRDAEKAIATDSSYAKGYLRLSRAHEVMGDISGAQDALALGLRHRILQDHVGLADGLINLQTGGKGFPNHKDEFEKLLRNIFGDDAESAERMKGVAGAYKKRCKEHVQRLGIA